MTFGKITLDNSIKYIPQSELTQERDSKAKTIKSNLNPRKQNEKLSQNSKNFNKNIAAEGFSSTNEN